MIACALWKGDSREMFKSRYSGFSFADSTTQRANGFFFSFSLAKLRSYFYLLISFTTLLIYVSYQALKPQRHHHSTGWGYTVPIFPKLVFRGLRVRLWCSRILFWFFTIHVFLMYFLPIKCIVLGFINRLLVFFFDHALIVGELDSINSCFLFALRIWKVDIWCFSDLFAAQNTVRSRERML